MKETDKLDLQNFIEKLYPGLYEVNAEWMLKSRKRILVNWGSWDQIMGGGIGDYEYGSTLASFDLEVRRKGSEMIQKLSKDRLKSHENMTSDI